MFTIQKQPTNHPNPTHQNPNIESTPMIIPLDEFVSKFIISIGLLAILDFGLAYNTKARYFLLHGIWNIIITLILLPDMYTTIIDPFHAISLENEPTRWPIIFVVAIHFWHCVAYRNLTYDDYFHHGIFVISLCGINFLWEWGYSTNFITFFICGLPGGIDYLMLTAVKHGFMDKITEKRWNKILNIWVRAPGCVASAAIVWINWMGGQTSHIPSIIKIMTIMLTVGNGQYYSKRVVASWAIHENNLKKSR